MIEYEKKEAVQNDFERKALALGVEGLAHCAKANIALSEGVDMVVKTLLHAAVANQYLWDCQAVRGIEDMFDEAAFLEKVKVAITRVKQDMLTASVMHKKVIEQVDILVKQGMGRLEATMQVIKEEAEAENARTTATKH